jgi:thymidylate synthase
MVSAWNVGELDQMVLPPCHYGFQVYTRELSHKERVSICLKRNPETKFAAHVETNEILMNDWNIPTRAISLMWNQRSVDVPLGLPFNIASYALLLEIIATITNMVPDQLIGSLGDCHIYENQMEGIKEQLSREPHNLPKVIVNTEFWPTATWECGVGPFTDNTSFLIENMRVEDFQIENYKSHPAIKMPLSN